MNIYQ